MTASPTSTRKSPGFLALILGALTALGPLSIDMYLPSLPALQRELGPARWASSSSPSR
ncbi:uncharacterized protein SOCE26_087040 [Sorangium cellulosum]|uniref:Major facilitator superfamily (MFS) profile domain-containing protein n=1 Tax=Sorangium cellulosum TaxID=56 RepID=A0A2L0F6N6_SORCE|nr:hypothetical protein [Sorangium cellulosum]AUX47192.1 uncharacterized protein SOCE26_087040 [Sorangium cellulosum]